jgi:type II secretory pathway pseudopilin PulG
MLVVVAIIAVMTALLAPAFSSIAGGQNLATTASDLQGVLEQARAYAMSKNVYVYVGFEEVDGSKPASLAPQVSGTGRLAVAIMQTNDGDNDFQTASWSPGSWLMEIAPLRHFENVHLTATALPYTGNLARPSGNVLQVGGPADATSNNWFDFPLGSTASGHVQYTFSRVFYFDPQGTPWVSTATSTSPLVYPYLELGLVPAHGNIASTGSNAAVIQIDGITGATQVYRP